MVAVCFLLKVVFVSGRCPGCAIRIFRCSNILDSENWRATEVPLHFQRIADECVRTQKLSDVASVEDRRQVTPQHSLIVDGESYVVVGLVFSLSIH